MKNIFRFLAKHKLAIFAAICCLVVQAYCDLALPTYTSDVLNVGLQQGGIADGVMDTVRADSLETLELFMTDADTQTVEQAYTQPNVSGVSDAQQRQDQGSTGANQSGGGRRRNDQRTADFADG